MTKEQKRNFLLGSIKQGQQDVAILGYVTFWNMRNVDVTQDEFAALLKANNLPETYAREHNYRSAFTRALRNMEEKRIIRPVHEDKKVLTFQFTEESKISNEQLEYAKEAILSIDKDCYFKTKKIEDALSCDESKKQIKEAVIAHFYTEKKKYNSSDITRYIQNILSNHADIVSLREQGCIYFVPVSYQTVMDNVTNLVRSMGASTMDNLPVPDVEESRKMVGNAFMSDIDAVIKRLDEEVTKVEEGEQDVTEKWTELKLQKIKEAVARIEGFSTILHDTHLSKLEKELSALEKRIAPSRKLKLESAVA